MASKLLNQTGQEADLVKELVNDLVSNLNNNKNSEDDLPVNSPINSDHDEDKDSINDDVIHNELKHHNGRNSISSNNTSSCSTEERTDDEEAQPSVEHERIQEYLNRKDTAVVYPVDVETTTNQTTLHNLPLNKLTNNSLSDQQPIKRKKNCKYQKKKLRNFKFIKVLTVLVLITHTTIITCHC